MRMGHDLFQMYDMTDLAGVGSYYVYGCVWCSDCIWDMTLSDVCACGT